MRKLIAIDLDGTLRKDDLTISDYAKEIISKLKKQGHIIVTCTARPLYHALEVNQEVFKSDYIICLSGSLVYDIKKNHMISVTNLEQSEVNILYNYALLHDIRISFNIEESEYITKFTRNKSQILLDETNKDVLNKDVRESMVIDSKKEEIKQFIEHVKEMNIIVSNTECEEPFFVVISKIANKGYGLKKLANYLTIEKQNIISFGNDENDISMFLESGLKIAVSNSIKELKDIADEIIGSNNDDSVAKRLEAFLNN